LQRHPAVIMRIRAPESKAQINSFGMMVCSFCCFWHFSIV
jgi:hypothetical protein